MMDQNTLYVINQEEYHSVYEPMYKMAFEPNFLIQIPIVLPFQMPFIEGTSFSIKGDDYICTFYFLTLTKIEGVNDGVLAESPVTIEVRQSRVEMIYVSSRVEYFEEKLSDYFDKLIQELNKFLMSYIITHKDSSVFRVSREMLNFTSLYRVVRLNPWAVEQINIFLPHDNVIPPNPTLSEEEIYRVVHYAQVIHNEQNPFMISEEVILSSLRLFKEGFYREAVIFAQTAAETFMNTVFLSLLQEEGKSPTEASRILEDTPFLSMVKNQFHPRIGGTWQIANNQSIVGKWYSHTYLLRNRVIHGGYYPSFHETRDAGESAVKLRVYIVSLLRTKKKKYPLTYSFLTNQSVN